MARVFIGLGLVGTWFFLLGLTFLASSWLQSMILFICCGFLFLYQKDLFQLTEIVREVTSNPLEKCDEGK